MLHYSCDLCKRPIDSHSESRHVVKIEVFPAVEEVSPNECCDADCSADDGTRSLRFDLCEACRQRFVKNPLGSKSSKQLDFSNN